MNVEDDLVWKILVTARRDKCFVSVRRRGQCCKLDRNKMFLFIEMQEKLIDFKSDDNLSKNPTNRNERYLYQDLQS